MAKKKDKFDLGMDTDDLIDFLGEDTSFFGIGDDDDDKKSEKKEEKKKLKKKLKKLGLDTSVLDEKKWKKKAKKLIKEAKEKKAEEKEKAKPIKLSKKDYKVSDVVEPGTNMPPYYYDKEQDQWVINKAMEISDPEAVVAVKAFAKCRNMHNNALGKFQIGIPGSRKQLDAPKDKKGAKDKIDAAIEVIDEALDKIQEAKDKEEPKSEALVREVVGEPKPKKAPKKKTKVIDVEPVDETKAELMKATHSGKE